MRKAEGAEEEGWGRRRKAEEGGLDCMSERYRVEKKMERDKGDKAERASESALTANGSARDDAALHSASESAHTANGSARGDVALDSA